MSRTFDIEALDKQLEKMFDESRFPNISVAIRGPEGMIYKRGFGRRRLDPELPVDENTIYGIASMSKSFTTLALAILQTEGKVNFDDPVAKHFPDFRVPGIPKSAVTLRHLAMHTAGIPPIQPLEWSIAMNSTERENEWSHKMREASPNKMDTIEDIIDYIAAGDYMVPGYTTLGWPGEYMSYSNEGYAILSYVVDKVAGMTLEEFLKERVFGPLEMNRTVLDVDGSEIREIAKETDETNSPDHNIAALFEKDEKSKLVWDDNYSILPPFRGCACVKSTAEDMSHYYLALADGGKWNGKQVIPAEAIELMVGAAFPLNYIRHYCLGLNKRSMAGRIICDHSGGLHGVSTQGGFIMGGSADDTPYSVVVLCSQGDVEPEDFNWTCYNMILGLSLETKHYTGWVPVEEEFSDPEMLVGDYVVAEGETQHFILSYDNGGDSKKYQVPTLHGDFRGTDVILKYCGGTRFEAFKESNPEERVYPMEFFIKDGKAIKVKCGSRIYQRIDE